MFFGGDYLGFDDALFAAARLLEIVSRQPVRARRVARGPAEDHGDPRDPRRRARGTEVRAGRARHRAFLGADTRSTPSTASGSRSRTAGACCAPRTRSRSSCSGSRRRMPAVAGRRPQRGRRLARRAGRPGLRPCPGAPAGSPRSSRGWSFLLFAGRWTAGAPRGPLVGVGALALGGRVPHRLESPQGSPEADRASRSPRPGSSGTCSWCIARSGSVQVRRNVANLEFREALTPASLLALAVASGAHSRTRRRQGGGVAHRAGRAGVAGRELWRSGSAAAARHRTVRRPGAALAIAARLRVPPDVARPRVWCSGSTSSSAPSVGWTAVPAINNHARAHLGWLLVGAGAHADVGLPARAVLSWSRATRAFPTAASGARPRWCRRCSPAWHWRRRCSRRSGRCAARHALAAAGWIVLPVASLVGHWMVPPAIGGRGRGRGRAADARPVRAPGVRARDA